MNSPNSTKSCQVITVLWPGITVSTLLMPAIALAMVSG